MDDAVVLLGAVSGLLGAAAIFLNWRRRTRPGAPAAARIDVLTTRYLGGKRMLTVVDVEGERLLLALSGDAVRLVTRLGDRRAARAVDLAGHAAEALDGEGRASGTGGAA